MTGRTQRGSMLTSYCAHGSQSNAFCSHTNMEPINCTCGEEETEFAWLWSLREDGGQVGSVVLGEGQRQITFNPEYSTGTATVRGQRPLSPGHHHYWELKMTSAVYGTDIMVGVCTPKCNLRHGLNRFCSLLGRDTESWGYSYTGFVRHDGEFRQFGPRWGKGSIVGLHLDAWRGTLSLFLNRRPLGVAFTGLQNKEIFPIVCSTSAHSGMKLVTSCTFPANLQFLASEIMLTHLQKKSKVHPRDVPVPPGLRSFIENNWPFLRSLGQEDRQEGGRGRGQTNSAMRKSGSKHSQDVDETDIYDQEHGHRAKRLRRRRILHHHPSSPSPIPSSPSSIPSSPPSSIASSSPSYIASSSFLPSPHHHSLSAQIPPPSSPSLLPLHATSTVSSSHHSSPSSPSLILPSPHPSPSTSPFSTPLLPSHNSTLASPYHTSSHFAPLEASSSGFQASSSSSSITVASLQSPFPLATSMELINKGGPVSGTEGPFNIKLKNRKVVKGGGLEEAEKPMYAKSSDIRQKTDTSQEVHKICDREPGDLTEASPTTSSPVTSCVVATNITSSLASVCRTISDMTLPTTISDMALSYVSSPSFATNSAATLMASSCVSPPDVASHSVAPVSSSASDSVDICRVMSVGDKTDSREHQFLLMKNSSESGSE